MSLYIVQSRCHIGFHDLLTRLLLNGNWVSFNIYNNLWGRCYYSVHLGEGETKAFSSFGIHLSRAQKQAKQIIYSVQRQGRPPETDDCATDTSCHESDLWWAQLNCSLRTHTEHGLPLQLQLEWHTIHMQLHSAWLLSHKWTDKDSCNNDPAKSRQKSRSGGERLRFFFF